MAFKSNFNKESTLIKKAKTHNILSQTHTVKTTPYYQVTHGSTLK